MGQFVQVITTTPDRHLATQIARMLIEKRLAACAQVSGPIESTYWWQGKIETSQEWYCVAKTRATLVDQVVEAIREHHSYEVPEIIALPIVSGNLAYLRWLEQETAADRPEQT